MGQVLLVAESDVGNGPVGRAEVSGVYDFHQVDQGEHGAGIAVGDGMFVELSGVAV